MTKPEPDPASEFEAAAQEPRQGFAKELLEFLATSWKWWLLPIVFVMLGLGLLLILGGSAAAPFIYTLF